MADLPADRFEQAARFTYSGVDYFGPFYIREERKELKRATECYLPASLCVPALMEMDNDDIRRELLKDSCD